MATAIWNDELTQGEDFQRWVTLQYDDEEFVDTSLYTWSGHVGKYPGGASIAAFTLTPDAHPVTEVANQALRVELSDTITAALPPGDLTMNIFGTKAGLTTCFFRGTLTVARRVSA